MRLTDIALDVDSQDAFGLLGAAARAAIPYLKDTLADNAVIDLKPFADHARSSMEAAIADFRTVAAGVRADVNITDLRLLGIEFDAKTLRVIAEAERDRQCGGEQPAGTVIRRRLWQMGYTWPQSAARPTIEPCRAGQ